jgi:hypothetical protein
MRKYNNVARLRHFCGFNICGTIFGSFGSHPCRHVLAPVSLRSPPLPPGDFALVRSRDPTFCAMKIKRLPVGFVIPAQPIVAFKTAGRCRLSQRRLIVCRDGR